MTVENKAGEAASPAIDLTKYVPKDEVEKAQTASKAEVDKLKSELDQAKMSLLDPELIAAMEDRKAKLDKSKAAVLPEGEIDVDKLTPKQLLNYALQKSVELVETRLDGRFRRSEQALSDVLAVLELKSVEEKYDDFGEYRTRIVELLEDPKSQLTIEQAYKLARSENPEASKGGEKSKESGGKKPSGEKPTGSAPATEFKPKEFKDKTAASLDAWDQVVGAGKDTL